MKLSTRLQMIADMVGITESIADVGTDHGWIPIYLIVNGKVDHAIAMDIAKGPLERAVQHITEHGLNDKIECRISDGMNCLAANEVNCAVIAGMGGDLIAHIIAEDSDKVSELIVSPHTHPELVRETLLSNGYTITDECSCLDSDKFYVVIKAEKGIGRELLAEEYYFGPVLLNKKDSTLYAFLLKKLEQFSDIEQKKDYIELIQKALKHYN